MSLINIGLILLSCLFHAFWNVQTQTSRNAEYFSGLKGVWIIAMALVFWTVFDFKFYHEEIIFWAALSGILHGFYILCLSRAYSSQDISYVYPIARSAPVFVPFFAYFLMGEMLGPSTVLAIILILAAIYTLHFEGHLLNGFRNLFDAILHRDLRWAFLTLAMVVAYSLVDKRGMETFVEHFPEQAFANGIVFFFMESIVGFGFYITYLMLKHPVAEILPLWREEWKPGLLAAGATLGSYGVICVVLQFEPVSAIVALRQVSVLIVVYWGCWKLGEPFGGQRIFAGGLIISGVALIWSSS